MTAWKCTIVRNMDPELRDATFHTDDPEEADDFLEHAHAFGRDRKDCITMCGVETVNLTQVPFRKVRRARRCSTRDIRRYGDSIGVA